MIFNIENYLATVSKIWRSNILLKFRKFHLTPFSKFWIRRRATDLPDVKNWKSNEERKWDNTKVEVRVACATKFSRGGRNSVERVEAKRNGFFVLPSQQLHNSIIYGQYPVEVGGWNEKNEAAA